jgi:hypothetical protein
VRQLNARNLSAAFFRIVHASLMSQESQKFPLGSIFPFEKHKPHSSVGWKSSASCIQDRTHAWPAASDPDRVEGFDLQRGTGVLACPAAFQAAARGPI